MTTTTVTSDAAWSPDVQGFLPSEVIPDALVLKATTVVGRVEGDEPAVRVPWVADPGTVGFVDEGDDIPEAAPDLSETVVLTRKVATLAKVSREQLRQPQASRLIVNAMQRGVIASADAAFLSNATTPVGLLALAGTTDGGTLTDDLDPLADAMTTIEADGGAATHIIAAPDAWGHIAKLKTGTGSAAPLLGAGTEQAERRVLSLPVLVTAEAPAGTIVVVDSGSIVSAVGDVQLATSEHAYFGSDSVAVRVTFRLGWAAMHPVRVVKMSTITAP